MRDGGSDVSLHSRLSLLLPPALIPIWAPAWPRQSQQLTFYGASFLASPVLSPSLPFCPGRPTVSPILQTRKSKMQLPAHWLTVRVVCSLAAWLQSLGTKPDNRAQLEVKDFCTHLLSDTQPISVPH